MQGNDKHGAWLDDELSKEAVEAPPRDLDDRAALAAVLGKEIWPAFAETVQRRVAESLGPDRLRDLVARLKKNKAYASLGEVWSDITDEPAQRRF